MHNDVVHPAVARDFEQRRRRRTDTNYDTSADKFQNYYKDLSMQVKKREVAILMVVNMFLTDFYATAQNTPWVDKNLKKYLGVVRWGKRVFSYAV